MIIYPCLVLSIERWSDMLDLGAYLARASVKMQEDLLIGTCNAYMQACAHHRLYGGHDNMSQSGMKKFHSVNNGRSQLGFVTTMSGHYVPLRNTL